MSARFAITVRLSSLLALLLFALPLAASTGAVNKWVDADGVTHYSDKAPDAEATEVTSVEVTVSYSEPVNAEDDYYSIANQWKRIHAERQATAKIKLEKALVEANSKPDVVYVDNYERQVIVNPVFWLPRHRKRVRRYHPRPGHPVAVPYESGRHRSGSGALRARRPVKQSH